MEIHSLTKNALVYIALILLNIHLINGAISGSTVGETYFDESFTLILTISPTFSGTATVLQAGTLRSTCISSTCGPGSHNNVTFTPSGTGITIVFNPVLSSHQGNWQCQTSSGDNFDYLVSPQSRPSGDDDEEELSTGEKGGIGAAVSGAAVVGAVAGLVFYKKRRGNGRIDDDQETVLLPINNNIEIGKDIPNTSDVKWLKDGIEVANNHNNPTMYTITKALLKDEGVYTCTCMSGSDNIQLKYHLIVVGRAETAYVRKGHTIQLGKTICDTKVAGNIKWMLDGVVVDKSIIHGTIINIVNASTKDEGSYVCTFGSNNMQLTYHLILVGTEETLFVEKEKTAELGKKIRDIETEKNASWTKDGKEVDKSNFQQTILTINNASTTDEGKYICTFGSNKKQLTYHLLLVGTRDLICVYKGGKAILGKTIRDQGTTENASWTKDGTKIKSTQCKQTLMTINNVSTADEGTYVCTFGSTNMQMTFYLILVGTEETVYVNIEDSKKFGKTLPDIDSTKKTKWKKDGAKIQSTYFKRTVVTIDKASTEDEGTYVCTIGSTNMKLTYYLIVVGTKETVRVKKGNKVQLGKTIRDMDTTKSAKWSKDGSDLQSHCFQRTSIAIENASSEDEGTYVCTFGTPPMQLTYNLVLEVSTNTATNGNETTIQQHGMAGQSEDQCHYINETEKSKHIGSAQASEKDSRKSSPSLTNLSEAAK